MLFRHDRVLPPLVHRSVELLLSFVVPLLLLPLLLAEAIAHESISSVLLLLLRYEVLERTLALLAGRHTVLHSFAVGVFTYRPDVEVNRIQLPFEVVQPLKFPAISLATPLPTGRANTGGVCEQCLQRPSVHESARVQYSIERAYVPPLLEVDKNGLLSRRRLEHVRQADNLENLLH